MEEHSVSERLSSSSDSLDAIAVALDEIVDGERSFAERETMLLAAANEVVRRALEKRLQRMAQEFSEHFVMGSERFRRHQVGVVEYHSLCGPLEIKRYSYRKVGVHNGPTVIPLDIHAGLVESSTPALAFSVAHAYGQMPSRDYEAEMRAAHRAVPSRSTIERVGKAIGSIARQLLPACEPMLRAGEPLPVGTRSLSIGLDRTAVPMHEDLPVRRSSPSTKRRTKPHLRRPPAPFEVVYRMAYVGTVAAHDADGETIRTWRFAATPGEGGEEIAERMLQQVSYMMLGTKLPLVLVQDGAPELWRLLQDAGSRYGIKPTYQIIDRFHLNERIAKALDILIVNRHERYALLEQWQNLLNSSDAAIDRIASFLQRELAGCAAADPRFASNIIPKRARYARSLGPKFFSELADHVGYICGHRRRFRYASLLERNLPIGSGVTEGACKSVIGTRFKRSGARWREEGLSACLTLRTLQLSERLQPMWSQIQNHYSSSLA